MTFEACYRRILGAAESHFYANEDSGEIIYGLDDKTKVFYPR